MSVRLRPVVGLDIGSRCVKAVALRRTWRGWQLAAAAAHDISKAGDRKAAADRDLDPRETAVRRALDALRLAKAPLVTSLGGQVFVKRLALPAMSRRELDEAIPWLADEHVPFDLAEVHLDYHVLERTRRNAGSALQVLLVAARRTHVADRIALVANAGREVAVLDAEAFGLVNAYQVNYPGRTDRLDVLIHIGAERAIVCLVEHGCLAFTREISIAGRPQGELPRELGAHLASEIRKTMDFYGAATSIDAVDRLVVSGGACGLESLADLLTAEFDAPVETFDPVRRICGAQRLAAMALPAPSFAVAIGLAMRRDGDGR